MFVFGVVVSDEEQFERLAEPSAKATMEEGDRLLVRRGCDSIFSAYNDLLAAASLEEDLEALVLMHQDVEIVDPGFHAKLRGAFAEPDVWLAGPIGGRGVDKASWWDSPAWVGRVKWNPYPGPAARPQNVEVIESSPDDREASGDIDILDGLLIAFSAPAVRELRFDESLGPGFHGYDTDICLQARERGKRVRAEPIDVIHHNDGSLNDRVEYARGHLAVSRKWGL